MDDTVDGRCATDLPTLLPLAQQQITEEFGRLDGGLTGAPDLKISRAFPHRS